MAQAYAHGTFTSRTCKVGLHRARFCEELGANSIVEIAGEGGSSAARARIQVPLQFHEPPDRLSLLKIIPAHQFDRGGLSKFGQKWTKICPNMSIEGRGTSRIDLSKNPGTKIRVVGTLPTDYSQSLCHTDLLRRSVHPLTSWKSSCKRSATTSGLVNQRAIQITGLQNNAGFKRLTM